MSEEQTQQLLYQMQMLENMFGELTQKERSIINIIREANSAIHSIKGIRTQSESDNLIPLGLGAFMKTKANSDEKIIMNIGSGIAIEKTHDEAINYLESRIKELEIALQDTNKQRQQIAANLEQGNQQMHSLMQKPQNPTKYTMFDNLKKAFSDASKGFSEKELKEKDIDEVLFQLEISLLESDVAIEVIDSIKKSLKEKLIGMKIEKKTIENFVKQSLIQFINETFDGAGNIDLISRIQAKKETSEPFIIVFVGINGTGKTTSLAKVANLLKNSKFSLAIAAADTFRAGAIEQLREHANRLNLKIIAQNYGSDPASVARLSFIHI